MNNESAQTTYTSLEGQRWSFLDRGRTSAELTIPYVLPPEGHGSATKYYTPYQGIGARGVNNLASKLLIEILAMTSSQEWNKPLPLPDED